MNDYRKLKKVLEQLGADIVFDQTIDGKYFIEIYDPSDSECCVRFDFDTEGKFTTTRLLWSWGD